RGRLAGTRPLPRSARVRRVHPLHRNPRIRASHLAQRECLPPALRHAVGQGFTPSFRTTTSLLRLQKSDGPFFVNEVASAILAGAGALPDELDDLRGRERRVERE